MNDLELSDFPAVVADFRSGRMVIIVDDANRENEGDLTLASSMVTADAVNFMSRNGR